MGSPPDFAHLFIRQFWQILRADYPSQYGWRGQREDTARTTRYSCSTVVGHVIVNRETRVQIRLDHQSGTKNDILLGLHKKNLCFSSDALSHKPAMLRRWAWILHLLILNGGNGLELACNRGSGILLPRISIGCKLQSWTKVLGQLYSSNAF